MASCWPLLATVLKFTAENPSLRMHTRAALALIKRFQLAQKAHADAAPPFSGRHPSRVAPHVPLQKLGAISMLAAVARTLEASARAPAGEDCDADGIADDAAAGDAHLDVDSGAAQHDERSEFALAEAASIIGERLAETITPRSAHERFCQLARADPRSAPRESRTAARTLHARQPWERGQTTR